jgi:hypothetical protein
MPVDDCFMNHCSSWHILWNRVLLEKLIVSQLVKKLPKIYQHGHKAPPPPIRLYPEVRESSPHPHTLIPLRPILSCYLRLRLPSSLFLSGFPTKNFVRFEQLCGVIHYCLHKNV